jgi:hypothetical protein
MAMHGTNPDLSIGAFKKMSDQWSIGADISVKFVSGQVSKGQQ